jgi:hypothetical protein
MINADIIEITKEMCETNTSYARQRNELSKAMNKTKGLRYPCSLSAEVLNIYMEWKKAADETFLHMIRSLQQRMNLN